MILPNKFISYENSYLNTIDNILEVISNQKKDDLNVELMWSLYKIKYPNVDFQRFYNGILVLYMLGLLKCDSRGNLNEF